MNTLSVLKTLTASSIIAALLAVTTGCATPGYSGYGDLYEDIYKDSDDYKKHKKALKKVDKNLYQPAIEQRAANKVASMGYRVRDAKYNQGKRTVKVKATRGNQKYKIELDYPSYKVIKIKKN